MALQDGQVGMVGLGVTGDVPPNSLQPPLPDGIHLRWASAPTIGFPWYGYYLFRREYLPGKPVCFSQGLSALSAGPLARIQLTTAMGQIRSDRGLVLTDDFPPSGLVELDLAARAFLELALDQGWFARHAEVKIGFRADCGMSGSAAPAIEVRVYDQQTLVAKVDAAGSASQVQTFVFDLDRLTRVRLSSGPAALVDACVVPVSQDQNRGWAPLPAFTYPLTLPVTHPDYPARRGAINAPADESLALGRVRYGASSAWSGSPVADLHDQLVQLVVGGPGSTPMAQRSTSVPGIAVPPDSGPQPTMPNQGPYGLIMLGALNPAVAQMLGLYWVDETAPAGQTYDYLIVSDNTGAANLNAGLVLGMVGQNLWSQLDGHITYGLQKAPSPPLQPPSNPRGYVLPGGIVAQQGGGTQDWSNNAGLTWDISSGGQDALTPGSGVLYHVWRGGLGNGPQPATPTGYDPITRDAPVLVVPPDPTAPPPQRPSDWPPFRLQYTDSGLADGWYGYELSGIDIFGRHSVNSAPAAWHQWAPEPDPKPWYYIEPPADRIIHPSALRLKDVIPPPPPTGLRAWALDPADPFLRNDVAYQAWFASLSQSEQSQIGLRVSWLWPWPSQRQAPDTQEFRVYLNPGCFNALLGSVTAVATAAAGVSRVSTDIANTRATDAYAGTFLRMGALSYRVTGSDAGTPLVLRVQNTASPTNPAPGTGPCTVTIPPNHSLATDTAIPVSWSERRYVVDYQANVTVTTDVDGNPLRKYEILLPAPGDADRLGFPLIPSITDPIAYAAVGVTAADDKTYIGDDPKWSGGGWGNRHGNESFVAGPATVCSVFRGPVPKPVVPADSDAVYASAADYHSRSFYTYRWAPVVNTKMHLFRAMDDAVFSALWAQSPHPTVSASDDSVFPSQRDEPRWDPALRAAVVQDIQQLAASATAADARDYFRTHLSNDALRVLAGLPGVRSAFSQLTIRALDPDDPANADRPGPDTPAGYVPDAGLRAYIDTLDGRSANRWFYRSAFVDGAHNVSDLSLASPPVYLPDVVAPRAPALTGLVGGDRTVTVQWASNREPDLQEYRVYRAPSAGGAPDVRIMTLVHVEGGIASDPAARPTSVQWDDTGVTAATTYWYRLTAADDTGNESLPSPAAAGRAYDDSRPDPPTWNPPVLDPATGHVALSWTAAATDLACLVERQLQGAVAWEPTGRWLPRGQYQFTDTTRIAGLTYVYRLRVRDQRGRTNRAFNTTTA